MGDFRPGAGAPRVGERLGVAGQIGMFVVLRVDATQKTADLLSVESSRHLLEAVAWANLKSADDPGAQM